MATFILLIIINMPKSMTKLHVSLPVFNLMLLLKYLSHSMNTNNTSHKNNCRAK